jgi:hypothetical protein
VGPGAVECGSCGVILAKARTPRKRREEPESGEPSDGEEADDSTSASPGWSASLWAALLPPPKSTSRMELVARGSFLLILAVWGGHFLLAGPRSPAFGNSFLHLVHLVFHEAGHVLFMPFGRFLMVLGGGLLQVLVPLVFVVYFLLWRQDVFAAAVCTAWAGHSLMDLAPYISDARALDLVLLGGRTGKEVEGHDFEYLLGATGLLRWDIVLGRVVFLLGSLLVVAGLVWGAVHTWRERGPTES